ncbi:MAG: PqqD family protein [Prevotella sp.]|nr:PqqD family protein [Prevotella sp.]
MRTKKGFHLRSICGEQIIVAEGKENIDFSKIISMNESAAYLWQQVQDREFCDDDLTDMLLKEYDVDEATARKDVLDIRKQWLEAGIVEE